MSASAKIPLSGLSRGELEALAERLLAENAALKQALAELRAEVATLKGVKDRPKLRPSGMEKGTEPEPDTRDRGRGAGGRKARRLSIDEERVIAAEISRETMKDLQLSPGSRCAVHLRLPRFFSRADGAG